METNKAIFWDRDGILNHVVLERQDGAQNASPQKFEDFKLVANINQTLAQIKLAGYLNIVVTNQPDISRNIISWEELNKMHDFLKAHAPDIGAIYVCPHKDSDNCHCRKPKPGLLLDAAKDYHLNLTECFMVGDRQKDIGAAKAAGVTSIVFRTHYNQEIKNADFEIKSLEGIFTVIK